MNSSFNKSREEIYAALFAKLAALVDEQTVPIPTGKIRYASRRLRPVQSIDASMLPAVFMAQIKEVAGAKEARGGLIKWTLNVEFYVFCDLGNDDTSDPMTQMNGVLDAIEAALAPTPGSPQTLGKFVHDCRIVGEISTDEGTLGTHAVAVVPVEIIA